MSYNPTYGDFSHIPATPAMFRNVGWTLGNDCPYRCVHCYSAQVREKGRDLSKAMIDRIVNQLATNGIETVNLGGNEPLFTNGSDPNRTLLPYIIYQLVTAGIQVGLTTSGISLIYLFNHHRKAFELLNDVDISLDSPREHEHNANRGANLYRLAIEGLSICRQYKKPHTIIMTGMKWNFTVDRLEELVATAYEYDAFVRINPLKPTESSHIALALPRDMYYAGFAYLMNVCQSVDIGESLLAAVSNYTLGNRCPCGRTSFRINSVTPTGEIFISPCVYLHDLRVPLDLLKHNLVEIVVAPQFRLFDQRHAHPQLVEGCQDCELIAQCGGGCVARAYLHSQHTMGTASLWAQDPYCPQKQPVIARSPVDVFPSNQHLVHMDYLCTWIGRPKP